MGLLKQGCQGKINWKVKVVQLTVKNSLKWAVPLVTLGEFI